MLINTVTQITLYSVMYYQISLYFPHTFLIPLNVEFQTSVAEDMGCFKFIILLYSTGGIDEIPLSLNYYRF